FAPRLRSADLGSFSGAVGAAVSSMRMTYRDLGVAGGALADLPPERPLDLDGLLAVAGGVRRVR
ncbi:MAG: hypothetical protein ACTHU7_14645, partial [Microbacterium sp.]